MVEKLVERSVLFMATYGTIDGTGEQGEVYRYGMELQVYYTIHAVLLVALGLVFGRATEVALLLFLFGKIQSNGGGYHAETHGRCLSIMVLGVLTFIFLFPIYNAFYLQVISIFAGLAAVVAFAPVAHKNHPLSPQKSKRMGRKAKIIAAVMVVVWCLLSVFGKLEAVRGIISITMAFSAISMTAALLK